MKFAERLAAHITPEWNSQYIKYDVNIQEKNRKILKIFILIHFRK